jgi:hypothetical protein
MTTSDKKQTPKVKLDCWSVIQHFGGLSATAKLFREHGITVNVDSIEKWRRRGSIPSASLITLASIAKLRGVRFDLYDFITESDTNGTDTTTNRRTRAVVTGTV